MLGMCLEAADQRLCLRLSQYMAAHQSRNPVYQIMYLAINVLLANNVVKFPFTVGVFNLRDVARSWEDVVTMALGRVWCEAIP